MEDRRCCFTSSTSTWEAKSFADCSKHKQPWAFLRCDECTPGGPPRYRCTECYHKFQATLNRRLPELEQHMKCKALLGPELKALSEINFRQLAGGTDAPGHEAIELVEEGDVCVWRWRGRCPCCFDFVVDKVAPVMPTTFASCEPNIVEDIVLRIQAPVVDTVSGLEQPATWHVVRVITLGAVLTREEELLFKFRAVDPPEHLNYLHVWKPPAWPADAARDEQRWALVRSRGSADEEPKALSLIAWRMLENAAPHQDAREVGMALFSCMREAAGETQEVGE